MHALDQLDIQYITDAAGEKRAVILPIAQFYELLEDLEDLAMVVERRNEPTISYQQLLETMSDRISPIPPHPLPAPATPS